MNNQEINNTLRALTDATLNLEATYIENEGEVTEETELQEEQINAIKQLLCTEGIDSLGRWLKAKEDEKKSLKAEKDYLARRMTAIDNTLEYIKGRIGAVMVATGNEKIKGSLGYSFAPSISETTEVKKDILKALYEDRLREALTMAHIPAYITATLGASSSKAKEYGVMEGDEEIFETITRQSCRFTKPRASKSEE